MQAGSRAERFAGHRTRPQDLESEAALIIRDSMGGDPRIIDSC